MKNKVILVIRDGWGYRHSHKDNAIFETPTPNTDDLMQHYPNTLIDASGEAVGLPKGYQGNSEVGHMTIGSGRIPYQSLTRINKSITDGSFFQVKEFLGAIENCKKHNTKLHLIGLVQVEGVHSHINHLYALLKLCQMKNFQDVYIHFISDGRDSPVTDSLKHLKNLKIKLKKLGFGKIATVSGRYYTMDRDNRWDRTKKAYNAIVKGKSISIFKDPDEYIRRNHVNKITDEFIVPGCLKGYKGVKPKDSMIFFNFRTDRPRQFTKAVVEPEIIGHDNPLDVFYVAMTEYYEPMNAHIAFKEIKYNNLLGQIISYHNLHQLRISETEKYAHVTFFFNGQEEKPYPLENRELIHSPKVSTYDLQPEMSAYEVTSKLIAEIKKERYEFIVVNLVNGDMVGHTGNVKAIKKAVATVDDCVGQIVKEGLEHNYHMLIFADHGNVEDQRPEWRTSHTINKVPLIFVSQKHYDLQSGKGLQDIAPTVLDLFGLEIPAEMTGESILEK